MASLADPEPSAAEVDFAKEEAVTGANAAVGIFGIGSFEISQPNEDSDTGAITTFTIGNDGVNSLSGSMVKGVYNAIVSDKGAGQLPFSSPQFQSELSLFKAVTNELVGVSTSGDLGAGAVSEVATEVRKQIVAFEDALIESRVKLVSSLPTSAGGDATFTTSDLDALDSLVANTGAKLRAANGDNARADVMKTALEELLIGSDSELMSPERQQAVLAIFQESPGARTSEGTVDAYLDVFASCRVITGAGCGAKDMLLQAFIESLQLQELAATLPPSTQPAEGASRTSAQNADPEPPAAGSDELSRLSKTGGGQVESPPVDTPRKGGKISQPVKGHGGQVASPQTGKAGKTLAATPKSGKSHTKGKKKAKKVKSVKPTGTAGKKAQAKLFRGGSKAELARAGAAEAAHLAAGVVAVLIVAAATFGLVTVIRKIAISKAASLEERTPLFRFLQNHEASSF